MSSHEYVLTINADMPSTSAPASSWGTFASEDLALACSERLIELGLPVESITVTAMYAVHPIVVDGQDVAALAARARSRWAIRHTPPRHGPYDHVAELQSP